MISKVTVIELRRDNVIEAWTDPVFLKIVKLGETGHLSLSLKQTKELIADLQQAISEEEADD